MKWLSFNYARLKLFGNANAQSAGLHVHTDGVVYVSDVQGSQLARIAVAQNTPADTIVAEFYNSILNHYFVTANLAEAASIDSGGSGPGWSRTGETWKAWVGGPISGAAEVCRFYGSIDIDPMTGMRRGPNSHFYKAEPAECAAVKLDPRRTFEFAGKFWMIKPTASNAGRERPPRGAATRPGTALPSPASAVELEQRVTRQASILSSFH